jgi:pimeloyl-ACP methyl ester carboxylesterase
MKWRGLFFNQNETPLFGLYHQPLADRPISEAIVLCYPAPFEIRRTYSAHRNLAQNLSRRGYHVLRFDYRGTGDSPGGSELWNLEHWQKDIQAAVRLLQTDCAIQRISVVGTRLGGTLAWKALNDFPVRRMVLWDPVIKGADYYEQLRKSHYRLLHHESDKPPYPIKGAPQALGFALNEAWVSQLNDIEIDLTESRRLTIIQSNDQTPVTDKTHPVIAVEEAQHWDNPFLLQMQSFSHKALAAIEDAIEGKA